MFQFYRELINFHSKGNPEVMLKAVNPSEVSTPCVYVCVWVRVCVRDCVCVCACVQISKQACVYC